MSECPDFSRLTSDEKDARIDTVLDQVEAVQAEGAALRAETAERKRRLGMNSSNRGKPPARDGYKTKPRLTNLGEKTGKPSGGQAGHEGKTLRQVDTPETVSEHCPPAGAGCGAALGMEQAPGQRKRPGFELPEPHPRQGTEPRAQWGGCPYGGEETEASCPEDVPAPTQYGARVATWVV
jgi:transposase